eukprot:30906-Pelagococcus_subviridis.AAC.6
MHLAAQRVTPSELLRERDARGAGDAVARERRRDVRLHRLPRRAQRDVALVVLRVRRPDRGLERARELVRADVRRRLREVLAREIHETRVEIALTEEQVPLHREAVLEELVPLEEDSSQAAIDPALRLRDERVQGFRVAVPEPARVRRRGGDGRSLRRPPVVVAAPSEKVDALPDAQNVRSLLARDERRQHRVVDAVPMPPQVLLRDRGVRGHEELRPRVVQLAEDDPILNRGPRDRRAQRRVAVLRVRVQHAEQRAALVETRRVHEHREQPKPPRRLREPHGEPSQRQIRLPTRVVARALQRGRHRHLRLRLQHRDEPVVIGQLALHARFERAADAAAVELAAVAAERAERPEARRRGRRDV